MMTTAAGKPILRMDHVMGLLVSSLWLAGCAGAPGVFGTGETESPFADRNMSMQSASHAIVAGKSTKADILVALGPATVVTFDSGFEVWVYRAKSREPAATKAELVILFAPTGIVKKTRLRPPDGGHGE